MLRIRLLGGFEASLDEEPLPSLGPQLQRLLALLTLEANHPVEKSRLLREIWPDSATSDIVRASLLRLRACLKREQHRLQGETGTVCLDMRGAWVDVIKFAALIEQNTPEALEQAVKLYRGPLLRDWEGAWIDSLREDLEFSYLDALKALANQAMEVCDYLKAAHYLRRFVNGCPEMDSGWEALIRSYLLAGNRIRALETYEMYVDFLRRESSGRGVALTPSLTISALVEEARKAEQAGALAQIQTPVKAASIPCSGASVSAPRAAGGAVPIGSSYYIERPEEAEVYSSLAHGGCTVLIKGPRQIGKTSLLARALHYARQNGAVVLLTD